LRTNGTEIVGCRSATCVGLYGIYTLHLAGQKAERKSCMAGVA